MGQKIFKVDAFADKPFTGNPTGVCILAKEATNIWMQQVAREMHCTGTVFVLRENGQPQLRFFNMHTEAEVRGHAALACAHILWQEGYTSPLEEIQFKSAIEGMSAKHIGGMIEINLPTTALHLVEATPLLLKSLGNVKTTFVGKTAFDDFVEVDSEELLRQLKPDLYLLEMLPTRGVIVTARSAANKYDFISRYFAPSLGFNEVFVSTTTHCVLASYWAQKLNKKELKGYQASTRGGEVGCRWEGERTYLQGQAITTLRCELLTS